MFENETFLFCLQFDNIIVLSNQKEIIKGHLATYFELDIVETSSTGDGETYQEYVLKGNSTGNNFVSV